MVARRFLAPLVRVRVLPRQQKLNRIDSTFVIRELNPTQYWMKKAIILIFTVLAFLVVGGCSSHKKSVISRKIEHAGQIKIHNEIERNVEKELKGQERIIVEEAFEWIGTKYEYGQQTKGKSTDCSGMVMVIYEEKIGCKLPRNSAQQAEFCKEIKPNQAKAGDLVFFITNGRNKINHVGIMIDNKQFIHAGSKGVVVSSLESDYYAQHMQKTGRVPCMEH